MSTTIYDEPQIGPLPNFDTLFVRHRERIYRLAYRMLSNRSDAEDITQEAFLRAWANYNRFDPAGSFEAWIYRIAYNLCIEQFRRRGRRPKISLEMLPDSESSWLWDSREIADTTFNPDRCLLAILEREEVQKVVNKLPPTHRDVVFLLQQERSYAEISEILDCPIGTVRSRVHRARLKMREALVQPQI